MKTKSFLVVSLVVTIVTFIGFSPASAIHPDCEIGQSGIEDLEDQIECAIETGIVWLAGDPDIVDDHGQQLGNGSWDNNTAVTGLALVKLQERAFDLGFDSPFDPEYPYSDEIVAGWQYVLGDGRTVKQSLSVQTHDSSSDDPDTNGNGYGVYFQYDNYHNNYTTGICLMALAASGTPGRPNDGDLDFNGDSSPDTFEELAQEAVDWLAFSQTDSGYGRGGWDYNFHNNTGGRADNSISGYVVLGLRYAETPAFGFESTIPAFVKNELDIWIDYIQNDQGTADDGLEDNPDGGSGYDFPSNWVNLLKTGNLLFQMSFYGDVVTTQRVEDAIDYIEAHWDDLGGGSTGWRNPPHNQAMYNLMKGFTSLDIDTITVGGNETDWFLDPDQFAEVLVNAQNADGSWPNDSWDAYTPPVLSACWALLTLEKIAPPPPVNVEISLPECACDNEGYTVDISYTVERFNVDGTLDIYEDDNLVRTVDLTNFIGTATETVGVDSDTPGTHTWKAELTVEPVGGGTPGQADDEASLEVCETPEVGDILYQTYPFESFDLDDYLTYFNGLEVEWSASGVPEGWTVDIDADNVVTVTPPEGATDPATITFTASVECCTDVLCSSGDDATFTPNQPPDCSEAYADPACLWPPNHKFVAVNVLGVTDPDGDPVTITIIGITSDEATASEKGAGGPIHAPDASGVDTDTAMVRAERSGKADGRVYVIDFTASDGIGGECEGIAMVIVPHDQSSKDCTAIDSGQNYDATEIN